MNILKTTALVAGTVALMGTSAMALTVDATGGAGGGSVSGPGGSPLLTGTNLDFGFEWTSAPSSAFMQFTANAAFDVFFEDYDPTASGVSGIVLYELGDAANALSVAGSDSSTACDDAGTPEVAAASVCTFVADAGFSGSQNPVLPSQTAPLFGSVAAGTYVIGFYESGTPGVGEIDMRIAAVPVPAAGLLLAGALGGLGLARRRKG